MLQEITDVPPNLGLMNPSTDLDLKGCVTTPEKDKDKGSKLISTADHVTGKSNKLSASNDLKDVNQLSKTAKNSPTQ